jgi:hypothetical protein
VLSRHRRPIAVQQQLKRRSADRQLAASDAATDAIVADPVVDGSGTPARNTGRFGNANRVAGIKRIWM